MKFKITRTVEHTDQCPCEGAALESYVYADIRGAGYKPSDNWTAVGRKHRILGDGCPARDLDSERWVMQIEDLQALLEFIDKHGECVLSIDEGMPTIEIYDTYRE